LFSFFHYYHTYTRFAKKMSNSLWVQGSGVAENQAAIRLAGVKREPVKHDKACHSSFSAPWNKFYLDCP